MDAFFALRNPFLYVALVFALFYGWRAVYIFVEKKETYEKKKFDWWFHQVWFNALGAFIGWIVVFYLWRTDLRNLETKHFVALVIGFLGITGHLPYATLIGKVPK